MSNLDDHKPNQQEEYFPPTVATSPPVADMEINVSKSPGTTPTERTPAPVTVVEKKSHDTMFGVSGIVQRRKREDCMKIGSLNLTGLALLFSLLSCILMATNKRGTVLDFNEHVEYRYLLGIAILSTVYTCGKAFQEAHEFWTGKGLFQQRTSAILDFCGDQIMAYLLISAASSGVPWTNALREAIVGIFTNSSAEAFVETSAASIGMAFVAFFALAFSALISGYKLSTQSYT